MNLKIGCIIGGLLGALVVIAAVAFIYLSRPSANRTAKALTVTGVPSGVNVSLVGDLKNAEPDTAAAQPTAVVVSLPTNNNYYVGRERADKDALSSRIGAALKEQNGPVKTAYLAAGATVDYGGVVEGLYYIRREEIERISLIVDNRGGATPQVLWINVPPEPDPNFPRYVDPSPLNLLVTITRDLKLTLNDQEKPGSHPCLGLVPDFGSTDNPGHMTQCLSEIFRQRREEPHGVRDERTVTVKAPRTIAYGVVVKLIDALKGAGANPILLQIDDLSN